MYIPWDPPLVLHMLTSWLWASKPVTSPHASADVGLERVITQTEDELATSCASDPAIDNGTNTKKVPNPKCWNTLKYTKLKSPYAGLLLLGSVLLLNYVQWQKTQTLSLRWLTQWYLRKLHSIHFNWLRCLFISKSKGRKFQEKKVFTHWQ